MEPEYSTTLGIFTDRAAADRALEELRQAGFDNDQLRYITRDEDRQQGTAPRKESQSSQAESETRRIFFIVNALGRYQEACDILLRNGAEVTTQKPDVANSTSMIGSSARDDHGPHVSYVPHGTDR